MEKHLSTLESTSLQTKRPNSRPSIFVTPALSRQNNIKPKTKAFADDDDSKETPRGHPHLLAAPSTAARLTPHHHQVRAHCRGDAARQLERHPDTRRATFRDSCPPGRQRAQTIACDESTSSFHSDAGDVPPPSKPSVWAAKRGTTAGQVPEQGARDISRSPRQSKRLATIARH